MLVDFFKAAVIINILAATIRIATPLLLAAMGELVAERSGIMNMGVEGMMMFGVFTVWLVTFLGGNTVTAVLISLLVGAFLGLLLGMPLPLGISLLHADGSAIPWSWGINGAASALGTILAVVAAMNFGFNATILMGASIYLVAIFLLPRSQS